MIGVERRYLRLLFQLRASGHTKGASTVRTREEVRDVREGDSKGGDRFSPRFDLTDEIIIRAVFVSYFDRSIRLEHFN